MPKLDRKPPPPPAPEPQPKRKYESKKDYFTLPRFRQDFGAQHNTNEFWKAKRP